MANPGKLHHVDTRNIKEIVIHGLSSKVEELGEMRVPFVFTQDYPTKETFARQRDGNEITERRIVVRKVKNEVAQYAIGDYAADSDGGWPEDTQLYQGWVDDITVEISIWTTASDDRDNIVELIKIWMLELTHDVIDDVPFFVEHGVQFVSFLNATDEVNHDIVQNGVMHIGKLNYRMVATFFNQIEPDDLIHYKISLIGRVRECLRVETDG